MKKLKKLFKLIPVFCVAFVSGLSAVLSYGQELKPVKADNNSLISSRSSNNLSLTYTGSSSDGVSVTFVCDYTYSLYKNISNGTYSYVVTIVQHQSMTRVIKSGVTYSADPTSQDNSFTLIIDNMVRANTNTDLIFNLEIGYFRNNTYTNTSYGGYSYTQWIDNFSLRLTSNGFDMYSVTSNYSLSNPQAINISVFGNVPNVTANSTNISTFIPIESYPVDLTFNNYDFGYEDGYANGYNEGYNAGYQTGYNQGYENGFNAGSESREPDIDRAYDNGYSSGYSAGYSAGSSANHTAATIFSGILQVGMLPINVMLAMFNFEILGINLSAFVSALLTVCLTVIVIRTITGKGGNND